MIFTPPPLIAEARRLFWKAVIWTAYRMLEAAGAKEKPLTRVQANAIIHASVLAARHALRNERTRL
jgi:hypothetical protein